MLVTVIAAERFMFRSTSNETLATGDTIQASLQAFFPALTDEDVGKILEVNSSALSSMQKLTPC